MQDEAGVHIIYRVVSVLKASEIDFDHVTCERQLNRLHVSISQKKTGGKFVSLIFILSCSKCSAKECNTGHKGRKKK